jgi:TPR repeat protein
VKAQVLVGTGYLSGQYGLPQDENKAAKYFLAAALQNNAYAAFVVAGLYFDGVGIEKSVESARVWAQKSKDLGYPDAVVMVRAIDDAAHA